MSAPIISQRYARAALTAIKDDAELEGLLAEVKDFAATYAALPELRSILENPALPHNTRKDVFEEVLASAGGSDTTQRFLSAVFDRKRIALIADIAAALEDAADKRLNRIHAQVTTATKLKAAQLTKIREGLEKRSGKTVRMDTDVDPDLLGGVIAQMGGTVLDGSLRSRLQSIRRALLAEENA